MASSWSEETELASFSRSSSDRGFRGAARAFLVRRGSKPGSACGAPEGPALLKLAAMESAAARDTASNAATGAEGPPTWSRLAASSTGASCNSKVSQEKKEQVANHKHKDQAQTKASWCPIRLQHVRRWKVVTFPESKQAGKSRVEVSEVGEHLPGPWELVSGR